MKSLDVALQNIGVEYQQHCGGTSVGNHIHKTLCTTNFSNENISPQNNVYTCILVCSLLQTMHPIFAIQLVASACALFFAVVLTGGVQQYRGLLVQARQSDGTKPVGSFMGNTQVQPRLQWVRYAENEEQCVRCSGWPPLKEPEVSHSGIH